MLANFIRLWMLRRRSWRAHHQAGQWQQVPIVESGQPLVRVPRQVAWPYYAKVMGLVSDETMYLRSEVLERLLQARARLVSQGLDLRLYDGWRSVELQENLFWYYLRTFTAVRLSQQESFNGCVTTAGVQECLAKLPGYLQWQLHRANLEYVSWPSRDPAHPSPHATGGAADVWLFKDDQPADLGVAFDHMEEEAGAFYHLRRNRKRFANDREVCQNRSQLILAMTGAGFSCYWPEFWHFNFGNQMDGRAKGKAAVYSYIEP